MVEKKNAKNLREAHPVFVYESYGFDFEGDDLVVNFSYSAGPNIRFAPLTRIRNVSPERAKEIGLPALKNLIFHLGLAEISSYWKATCSPEIRIMAGRLDAGQLEWWKQQILAGMGEYFFENDIDFTAPDFLVVTNRTDAPENGRYDGSLSDAKILVPIGGGKDSLVTLSILRKHFEVEPFVLNNIRPVPAALGSVKAAGFAEAISVDRQIDKKLIELNKEGYLNGHVPFSMYLSFLLALVAVVFDYRHVALSNESSANEETVVYLGHKVNHQYSKSFAYEKSFSDYANAYLASDFHYFSFLRPLHELQIAKMFSVLGDYHGVFSSCNVRLAKNQSGWCGHCPKCLFVYAMIYPFVGAAQATAIFGRDLFEDRALVEDLEALSGMTDQKPFECVGTKEEVVVALDMAYRRNDSEGLNQPSLLRYFKENILPRYEGNIEDAVQRLLGSWDPESLMPEKFQDILRREWENVSRI